MTVQSSAYFHVQGQSQPDAVAAVRLALRDFNKVEYGVESLRIESSRHNNIRIVLVMSADDADRADADAERAAQAIIGLLRQSPDRSKWHERQRELTLA